MSKDNTKTVAKKEKNKEDKHKQEKEFEEISLLKNPLSTIFTLYSLILEQLINWVDYYSKNKLSLTLFLFTVIAVAYAPQDIYVNLKIFKYR